MNNLSDIRDQNLYFLCKTYGSRALEWRRKFIGLLPEVFKRKLYKKKGFESIFVFAKKLAGLSEEQVRLTLNLDRRLEKTPVLQKLLVNGEVSINKLARIVSIARPENEEFLASHVKILSNSAVETLVRDEQFGIRQSQNGKNRNSLLESQIELKSLHVQTSGQSNPEKSNSLKLKITQALSLTPEVHQKLLELQQKGLDLNRLLLEFLQKREVEITRKKEAISKAQEIAIIQKSSLESVSVQSRYIPQHVRNILYEEHGTKCAINNCQKRSENIHHTLPFSISKSHDPKFLVPLCKEHHELQHSINFKYQEVRAGMRQ